jgi:ryanodine receptor 2
LNKTHNPDPDKPMPYVPQPIDTSAVPLPPEVLELTERLAEHAHDVWARERLSQGWTYGPQRNDGLKHHPCLVPYADLPESEKVHDRNAALQTLKAVIALGYRITKG